ncbi:SRPBCC family protein [Flavobacterium sp. UBA7680]|uniref:SRPBCC family protein n=1 Tax=Flavobacterium sp. UBA7680 TaxID=1946559 RepID=UPI0025B805FA|nr:SRPBCC family protein [Flavobacterium sp. UBA7680]
MIHQLKRTQQLYCDTASAWIFFSSPNNLSRITPKDMGFIVVSDLPNETIYEGMIIDYIVSPLLRIPLKWQTKIVQVDHEKSFTDFQQKGPYKLWSHRHEFFSNEDGVLMIDTVNYELPFGVIGNLAHRLFIKEKLEDIFDFRYEVLQQLFNKQKNQI